MVFLLRAIRDQKSYPPTVAAALEFLRLPALSIPDTDYG